MKHKRLGKGLKVLLDEDYKFDYTTKGKKFIEIDIYEVFPNPFQPREKINRENLDKLKESISQQGIITPITVREKDKGYEIIAGERRWLSAKELHMNKIPAYVLDLKTDQEVLEASLVENIQREDLNPIEIATSYKKLMEDCGLTHEEIARKVGMDRTTVTNYVRILKLPYEIRKSIVDNDISMGHARALLAIDSIIEQTKLWKRIIKEKLSVRKIEDIISAKKKKKEKITTGASTKKKRNPHIVQCEDRIRSILGTRVKIAEKGEKGKIEIDFFSFEDLNRILELIETIENKY